MLLPTHDSGCQCTGLEECQGPFWVDQQRVLEPISDVCHSCTYATHLPPLDHLGLKLVDYMGHVCALPNFHICVLSSEVSSVCASGTNQHNSS